MALKEIGLREAIMTAGLDDGEVYALHRITADTPIRELQAAKFVLFTEEGEPKQKEMIVDNLAPKPKKKQVSAIDHGRIVALYRAGWAVAKIADDVGCTQQSVINHLKQEGIYKTLEERREAADNAEAE